VKPTHACWVLFGRVVLVWLGIILAFPSYGAERKAFISDIVLTNTRDNLLVYFTVKNCFTPNITKAIEAGVPTSFTFVVKLYEVKRFWPDRLISSLDFTHEVSYDNLKKQYSVRLSERADGLIRVKDFKAARKLMAEVVALKLANLKLLRKGMHYQVRMMAELDKIRLPLHLHRILFFLSLWDFRTDWYTLDFVY